MTGYKSRLRTQRDILTGIGRFVLWAVVVVVVLRGVGTYFSPAKTPTPAKASTRAAVSWPDQAAYAAAIAYARSYVEAAEAERASNKRQPKPAVVVEATAAGHVMVSEGHVRVTVDMVLRDPGEPRTRSLALTVPLVNEDGTVKVEDIPAAAVPTVPGPAPDITLGSPLTGEHTGELTSLLERYVGAYLSGDAQALEYLATPGTHPRASGNFRLTGHISVTGDQPARKGWLTVDCAAEDHVGAELPMRFRALVELRDNRWYVGGLQ